MAAAKRSSSSIWQTGKWDGLRSDCIATRAKGIYAAGTARRFLDEIGR